MSSLLKSLNKNNTDKFNPDVANLYNQTNQSRNTVKYQPTLEGYKTIMNDIVPKVVKSEKDLKVEYKKATEADRQITNKKINELENERLKEKQLLEAKIDHSKKLDELIKIKRRELNGKDDNYQATTHNELIKDERFVLIGRGLYALKEWGYEAGPAKDVITRIIEKEGPLTKEEIIERVKRERYLKDNTILVNLQNQKYFAKDCISENFEF